MPCARHYSKCLTTIDSLTHDNNPIIPTRKWQPNLVTCPKSHERKTDGTQPRLRLQSPSSLPPCPATSPLTLISLCKQNSCPCYVRSSSRFDIPSRVHKLSVLQGAILQSSLSWLGKGRKDRSQGTTAILLPWVVNWAALFPFAIFSSCYQKTGELPIHLLLRVVSAILAICRLPPALSHPPLVVTWFLCFWNVSGHCFIM